MFIIHPLGATMQMFNDQISIAYSSPFLKPGVCICLSILKNEAL